jgi:hypothetical protein
MAKSLAIVFEQLNTKKNVNIKYLINNLFTAHSYIFNMITFFEFKDRVYL